MKGGMQQLMKQANQMQSRMKKVQDRLASTEFEGAAGGDAVMVKVTGDNVIRSIKIKPEVINAEDAEILEDMVLTAVNQALSTAKETSDKELGEITGGLPGFGI